MLYVDSSALIKRYIRESGTDRLNAKLEEAFTLSSGIFVSVIGYAEVLATISRYLRENPRRLRKTDLFRRRFQVDWTSAFSRVELTADILDLVARLVKTHPLRGSDAIFVRGDDGIRSGNLALRQIPVTIRFQPRLHRLLDNLLHARL